MHPTTTDSALDGTLRVRQHRHGYRFSIDALLLADFARPDPGGTLLDLGTGCGIVALILARRHPHLRIFGVEVQPELALLAAENAAANGLEGRISILQLDLRDLTPGTLPAPIDAIVTNPPFRRQRSGRVNSDLQRAIARHEIKLTLEDLVRVSASILQAGGRFAAVYPADRLTALLVALQRFRLEPKMLRMVHSHRGEDAKRVLVEGVKGAGPGLQVRPPLEIYGSGGYTPEAAALFVP